MLFSPLEQFRVSPILFFLFELPFFNSTLFIDFSISNSTLMLILLLVLISLFSKLVLSKSQIVGSPWLQGILLYLSFIFDIVRDNLGFSSANYVYFSFIASLFTLLVLINLSGFIPLVFTPTTQLGIALTLSVAVWLGVVLRGLVKHKSLFFSTFMPGGTPLILALLLVPIELISYSARALSLGLRLCINVSTGHLLQLIIAEFAHKFFVAGLTSKLLPAKFALFFASLMPILLIFILSFLESGILIIQAFIFTVLTSIYIGESEELH